MNAQVIAQVANFLSVSPNQIKRCESWASVLFVQVHGCRPRFVSKKVVKVIELTMVETTNMYGEQGLKVFPQAGIYPKGGMHVDEMLKQVASAGYKVEDWTWSAANEFFPDLGATESVSALFCYLA